MWFTETPWPPILICGVLCFILGATWYQRQQSKYLFASLCCLIAMAGIWFVERSIVTPREQIEVAIIDMTSTFQKRETHKTLEYISQQSPQLKMLVTVADNLYEVSDDMRLTDLRTELSGQNTRATSRFRVNATVAFRNGSYSQRTPTRWETKWQIEGGGWKMFEIQQLDPITGERIDGFDSFIQTVPNFLYKKP